MVESVPKIGMILGATWQNTGTGGRARTHTHTHRGKQHSKLTDRLLLVILTMVHIVFVVAFELFGFFQRQDFSVVALLVLKLREPLASDSQVPGLKVCSTIPGLVLLF